MQASEPGRFYTFRRFLARHKKALHVQGFLSGERGIRTLGDISATFDFESSALDQLSHLSIHRCYGAGVL